MLAFANETKVQLIIDADVARPGETIWAGVSFELADDWHTYWRFGGDAAQETEIDWQLPKGIQVGEIHWPLPKKYHQQGIYSYVFYDEVILLVPISISHEVLGEMHLKAELRWLECKEECVPRKAELSATFIVGNSSQSSIHADRIQSWRSKLPPVDLDLPISVSWENEGENDERSFVVFSKDNLELHDFYPHGFEDFDVKGKTEKAIRSGKSSGFRKMVLKHSGDWPSEMAGLLAMIHDDKIEWVETILKFENVQNDQNVQNDRTDRGVLVFLKMGFFAILGGFILNFMPCVLPVIALKILGFVKQSQSSPLKIKQLGIVYAIGVGVSFLVLAGLVIATQQAGRLANWGMQFQSIGFLVSMTILVTLVSLNFFGVFEIHLGSKTMDTASRYSGQQGWGGAFFGGVLATILATPCVAPFLAIALGFAFTQPPLGIVFFFLMAAAGLAFPYVLLSWNPKLLKYLPKPGPWLGRFKVAMGFPMLATALWLYSIALEHFPEETEREWWLGFLLVLVALAAWIWGQFVQQITVRKPLSIALALIIGIGGAGWILEYELDWRTMASTNQVQNQDKNAIDKKGILWQVWSPEAVSEARSKGHPVLVDFTAKWCQNCQFNKRVSIEIDSVRTKLKDLNVMTFKADFTHYDARIARELKHYERAGVPMVLVFSANSDAPPQVLPPILTPKIVLDSLDRAAK